MKPIPIGQTFNRLTVIADAGRDKEHRQRVECVCVCGRKKEVRVHSLKSGSVKSCGCLLAEINRSRSTHGHSGRGNISSEYKAWQHLIERCTNSNDKAFDHYGGRGIKVCERWLESFENFLADMGPKPTPNHSIDRWPDMNGNYEKSNCRWATQKEQHRNQRNNNLVSFEGVTKPISQWAEELGINYFTLHSRITKREWSVQRALSR